MTPGGWLAVLLGATACIEDLRRRTIPNWLTAAGAVGGLACAAAFGWHALAAAALGGVTGFLLFLPLHLRGGMGGGDVKLMAAFGTILGPMGTLQAALFGAAAGGIWGLVAWLCGRRAIPYAPAIVLGVWISLAGGR